MTSPGLQKTQTHIQCVLRRRQQRQKELLGVESMPIALFIWKCAFWTPFDFLQMQSPATHQRQMPEGFHSFFCPHSGDT
ncbi:hypothetical protein NQZ68_016294 [Dissostichus eleginoides]|nr:hypothetical protein NQZ68_016294 [Dissostichus eleginoides]